MGITQSIQERLVAIESTMVYDGSLVKAGIYISEGIQDFQVPLFMNYLRPAPREQVADTIFTIERQWDIILFGASEASGGRSDNELKMYGLIDATYDLFRPKQRLELNGSPLAFVTGVRLSGDDAIELRPYPDGGDESQLFYTTKFNMTVEYRNICS